MFDSQVRLHVHHTLILALVELTTEFTGITSLTLSHNMLDVVVHADLLSVDLEQLLRVLRGLPFLLELRRILRLRRVPVLNAAADDGVYYTIYLYAILVL